MITTIILTKNEERNIEKCIRSLIWSDEIVVVDDYSNDQTIKKVNSFNNKKIKIFRNHLNNNFASQRNFGLSKAKGDWVLFIDSDEIVTQKLKDEIKSNINSNNKVYNAFFLKRHDFLFGKEIKHGEVGNIKLLRLAKREAGKFKRKVHEYWDIKENIGELKNPILHYPHPTISEFIEKINTYSSIHSKENKKEGKKSNLIRIIIFPIGKFTKNYFLKLGFLDGVEGFMLAILMSFHSFLSWSKQWTD